MFKFFQALANAANSLNEFAASVRESTTNFRHNMQLDHDPSDELASTVAEVAQVEHKNNGRKTTAKR